MAAFVARIKKRVYQHRARWTARKILPFIKPADNVEYAVWLYKTQGATPWRASEGCWGTGRRLSRGDRSPSNKARGRVW